MTQPNSINFDDARLLGTLIDLDGNEITAHSYLDERYDDNIRDGMFLEALLTHDQPYSAFSGGLDSVAVWGYTQGVEGLANGFVFGNGEVAVPHPELNLINVTDIRALPQIRTPGTLNIHVNLNRDEDQINRTIVHEIIHRSAFIDNRAESLVERYLEANSHIDFTDGQIATLRGGFEHVAIADVLQELISAFPQTYTQGGAYDSEGYLGEMLRELSESGVSLEDVLAIAIEQHVGPTGLSEQLASEGHTIRPNGSVGIWIDGDGTIGVTDEASYYSQSFLDHYGTVDDDGRAAASLGGHLRAFADWLGLDGEPGIQGTYSNIDEGNNTGSGSSSGDNSSGEDSNIGNYFGDRDNDGVPNIVDFDDGVGWADDSRNEVESPIIIDLNRDGVEITAAASVSFDWDGDGFRELGRWVSAEDGFLVLDLDADGNRVSGDVSNRDAHSWNWDYQPRQRTCLCIVG